MRTLVLIIATLFAGATAGAATGGVEPNLLDRNLGVVIPSATVHNLFWDNNWNTQHPEFTRADIDRFTARVGTSGWAASLSQYGVNPPVFASTHAASAWCGATAAPNRVTTIQVIAWATCMVTNPFTGVPRPGFRVPVSNRLYVVYLPSNTTITDGLTVPAFTVLGRTFGPFTVDHSSCEDYGAYHAFAASTTLFAFAIIPTRCAVTVDNGRPAFDNVMLAASHEVVEATTNPLIGPGWINRSLPVARLLIEGEAADICDFRDAAPRRFFGSLFSAYWSNATGGCVTS